MINPTFRIYRILLELAGKSNKIARGSRLVDDIGFDSFDLCCLFNSIEYRCNVIFNDRELSSLKTVGNVIDYVNKLVK